MSAPASTAPPRDLPSIAPPGEDAQSHANSSVKKTTVPSFRILFGLLCAKIAYIQIALLFVSHTIPGPDGLRNASRMLTWPSGSDAMTAERFAAWDAAHYLHISENGYFPGSPSAAFYPLWPALIAIASEALPFNALAIATLLANVLSGIAGLLLFRVTTQTLLGESAHFRRHASIWGLLLWLSFPGSLFFQFAYSESLFLFLLLLCIYALRSESYAVAAASALLLPLSRPVGVFIVIPLMYELRWALRRRTSPFGLGSAVCMKAASVAFAPLAGFAAYLCIMRHCTGNPWEGFSAQRAFWPGVNSLANLISPERLLEKVLTTSTFHDYDDSYLDAVIFVMLCALTPWLWKLDRRLCVWNFCIGMVPGVISLLTSFTRYSCVAFPLFIALGTITARMRIAGRAIALSVFGILHIFLLKRFLSFEWAG